MGTCIEFRKYIAKRKQDKIDHYEIFSTFTSYPTICYFILYIISRYSSKPCKLAHH